MRDLFTKDFAIVSLVMIIGMIFLSMSSIYN